jgi:hypothetical protein
MVGVLTGCGWRVGVLPGCGWTVGVLTGGLTGREKPPERATLIPAARDRAPEEAFALVFGGPPSVVFGGPPLFSPDGLLLFPPVSHKGSLVTAGALLLFPLSSHGGSPFAGIARVSTLRVSSMRIPHQVFRFTLAAYPLAVSTRYLRSISHRKWPLTRATLSCSIASLGISIESRGQPQCGQNSALVET